MTVTIGPSAGIRVPTSGLELNTNALKIATNAAIGPVVNTAGTSASTDDRPCLVLRQRRVPYSLSRVPYADIVSCPVLPTGALCGLRY